MYFSSLLACAASISTTISTDPAVTQKNGRTRLLGSSFGVLGSNSTFDYVITGGGTSGLTVANRLAKNPAVSVAVIEGGSFYEIDNGNYSQIPLGGLTHVIVQLTGEPSTQQLDGREIHYTQGKCLGGRYRYVGSRGSYQQWADNVRDQTYTFDNILPCFHFTPPDYTERENESSILYDPSAFSPTGGPLQVSYPNFYQPISKFFKQAFASLGLRNIAGLNSGNLLGFSEFTLSIDPQAGTRSSSETSFLQDAISTSTLQVYQQTLAQKILFDKNKTATGVEVVTAGIGYRLSARKQVILAAGPFRSPQMLMVSGIGPSATLRQLGIPILSEAEGVGQGMWLANASGIVLGPEFSPGPQTQTNAQILEYIRQTLAPIHHASATCVMGGANSSNAVVDSKGRVYGVHALRIVDSSTFPLLPPGHPQATVYMLAEKLAQDIIDGN